MSGRSLGRGATGLTFCLTLATALATNACAGAVPSRGPAAPSLASEGVAEAQAEGPAPPPATEAPAPATAQSAQASDPETPPPRGYAEAEQGSSAPADPHRTRRIYGYASVAIGGAAAVVAVVTSFMLLHQKSVLDEQCDAQKRCSSAGFGETGAIHQTVPLNTTAWIVAVVGLGAGTVLLVTSQPESGKSTAVTVSPTPGGAAFGLRSTF
jgi:hypothetical protein